MNRTIDWRAAAVAVLVLTLPLLGATGAVAMSGAEDTPTSVSFDAPPRFHAVAVSHTPPTKPDRSLPAPTRASTVPTDSVVDPPPAPSSPPASPSPAAAPPACPTAPVGTPGTAPSAISAGGVGGTSTADLAAFASAFNDVRVANCLTPIPPANFRYDACMEQRLFWIAEDPSTDPSSAWGHIGTQRSDGVPSVGCDGNLAGGMNNTGQTFAVKWWNSTAHRTSLYKPTFTGSTAGVCIYFAVTHGGVPDEPAAFARAAARWATC